MGRRYAPRVAGCSPARLAYLADYWTVRRDDLRRKLAWLDGVSSWRREEGLALVFPMGDDHADYRHAERVIARIQEERRRG